MGQAQRRSTQASVHDTRITIILGQATLSKRVEVVQSSNKRHSRMGSASVAR